MELFDIIVVGGGLSGLTAAVVAHEAGARVLLLDADAQIGGRIQCVTDESTGRAIADLGPTWVWPSYQPVVQRWLQRLGVETFAQFSDGDGVLDGWSHAVERVPLPEQDGIRRIVGGPSALVFALARGLPATSLRVRQSVVSVSDGHSGSLSVTLATGEQLFASRVILATPLRVTAHQIALPEIAPDLRRTLELTPTWMATQAKVVAEYDAPFWRESGLSGRIASRSGPLGESHDHCPAEGARGVIFGFPLWTPIQRRDEHALREATIAQLVRCFGPAAATLRALHIQDWATNPFVCSARDLAGTQVHPEPGAPVLRATHLQGRLTFAVSETSAISPGLIEGALISGERTALALI